MTSCIPVSCGEAQRTLHTSSQKAGCAGHVRLKICFSNVVSYVELRCCVGHEDGKN